MILGMTSREIRQHFDAIADFAEVGEFIDTPVKHYSSGMYVRLGFAIAIHAPVDVLLLDEVLAVGDLAFAIKCLRRISQFRAQGGSAVLVSHAMQNVKLAFDHALWIEKGEVRQYGPALEVANAYESYMMAKCENGSEIAPQSEVRVLAVNYPRELPAGERLIVEAEIDFGRVVERPIFCLHLHADADDSLVFSHHSDMENCRWEALSGPIRLRMETDALRLRRGAYRLSFSISERELINYLLWQHKQHTITVRNDRNCFGIADVGMRFEVVSRSQ
jgi:ABC-2 type transport system ATP-binding protein